MTYWPCYCNIYLVIRNVANNKDFVIIVQYNVTSYTIRNYIQQLHIDKWCQVPRACCEYFKLYSRNWNHFGENCYICSWINIKNNHCRICVFYIYILIWQVTFYYICTQFTPVHSALQVNSVLLVATCIHCNS